MANSSLAMKLFSNSPSAPLSLRCHCSEEFNTCDSYGQCNATGACFYEAQKNHHIHGGYASDEIIVERGCLEFDHAHRCFQKDLLCCWENFCNLESSPEFLDRIHRSEPDHPNSVGPNLSGSAIVMIALSCFVIFAAIFVLICKLYTLHHEKSSAHSRATSPTASGQSAVVIFGASNGSICASVRTDSEVLPTNLSSALVPRKAGSLADEIVLQHQLGEGTYGCVFLGVWQKHEKVAVKILASREIYLKEKAIYTCCSVFNHDFILQFIGADTTDMDKCPRRSGLWLVTRYLPFGTLLRYLQQRCVSEMQCLSLCLSLAQGLQFIHMEERSQDAIIKPAIAHRGIKSRNILIKISGPYQLSCVVGDFDTAISALDFEKLLREDAWRSEDFARRFRHKGTAAYMAPEVAFNEDWPQRSFPAVMLTDIYAMALVFWEIASRTEVQGYQPQRYLGPYQSFLAPGTAEVKPYFVLEVVHGENKRPPTNIPAWDQSSIMRCVRSVMQECWRNDPETRISALAASDKLSEEQRLVEQRIAKSRATQTRPTQQFKKRLGNFVEEIDEEAANN